MSRSLPLLLLSLTACVTTSIPLETRLPDRPPKPVYQLSDVPAFVVSTDLLTVRRVDESGLLPLGLGSWRFALGPEVADGLEQSLRLVFEEVELRDAAPVVGDAPALWLEPQIKEFDIGAFSLRTRVVLDYRLVDNRGTVLREASIQGRSSFGTRQLLALFTGFLFPVSPLEDSVERALQDVYTQLVAELEALEAAGQLPTV